MVARRGQQGTDESPGVPRRLSAADPGKSRRRFVSPDRSLTARCRPTILARGEISTDSGAGHSGSSGPGPNRRRDEVKAMRKLLFRTNRFLRGLGLLTLFLVTIAVGASSPEPGGSWSKRVLPSPTEAETTFLGGPIDLVLDDGTREVDIGFNAATASQFLWFNRFEVLAPGLDLEEIQVLFPADPEISAGDAVQLVVYFDDDGDPTNGADLLTAFDDVVGAADGVTFSTYAVDPPLPVTGSGDLLIGVVNRFVTSGVSPPSRPAALDNSSSQGRSWVAQWTGDPPAIPTLPPDSLLDTVDFIEPGNWMIRGSGSPPQPVDVPALGQIGLVGLALLLGLVATISLRRRADRAA